jgi:hypothetical protein
MWRGHKHDQLIKTNGKPISHRGDGSGETVSQPWRGRRAHDLSSLLPSKHENKLRNYISNQDKHCMSPPPNYYLSAVYSSSSGHFRSFFPLSSPACIVRSFFCYLLPRKQQWAASCALVTLFYNFSYYVASSGTNYFILFLGEDILNLRKWMHYLQQPVAHSYSTHFSNNVFYV